MIPVPPSACRVTAFPLEQVWRIHCFFVRARYEFWVIGAQKQNGVPPISIKCRATQTYWQNRCLLAFSAVINYPNRLCRCQNPSTERPGAIATQNSGIPFIVNSPLTPGFFQKIASTHRSSLMAPVLGASKRARKTLIKTILTKFERS